MPWKKEHADRRREKYHASPEERERRKAQGRTPEENKEYMREYYKGNKVKFKLTDEQRDERNRRRRERYAEDEQYREKHKAEARARDPMARRNTRLKKDFGITHDEYERILESQGGGCAICGSAVNSDSRETRNGKYFLHIDHCHATGCVRGILCSACNMGIGKFNDSPELLRMAAKYIEEARSMANMVSH